MTYAEQKSKEFIESLSLEQLQTYAEQLDARKEVQLSPRDTELRARLRAQVNQAIEKLTG